MHHYEEQLTLLPETSDKSVAVYRREIPCRRCGGTLFRKNRQDCLFCHGQLTHWRWISSLAVHRLQDCKVVPTWALMLLSLGRDPFPQAILGDLRTLGLHLADYGSHDAGGWEFRYSKPLHLCPPKPSWKERAEHLSSWFVVAGCTGGRRKDGR